MQAARRSVAGNRATPTRKLIRKSASAKDIRHLSDRVTLERVLGLTTSNKNGLTSNPYSGIIAYPAGCVIVLFNSRTNAQSHIFNPEKKTLTCLAFSGDGKYIVSGESGHNPRVRVWELSDTVTQVAILDGHKFSINCVAFSPNMKYLVSVGDQHDMLVNIWNWRTGSKVACNKIGCKVRSISFAEAGNYFVTVGNRHVKFWYFDTETGPKSQAPTPISGRSGILGELRNNCFCDVGCGLGDNSTNTYAVTKTGLLCSFNEKRILDRWVELRASGASSLTVNEKYIFCGCTDGIIRVFHPTTLHFISTLPKPHFLGVDVAAGLDASHMIAKDTNVRYPDVFSLVLDNDNDKLTCVYNDHSLYVWDVHDVKKVGKACSFLYHSACIWGVETYPFMKENQHPCLPIGSFLTCASDDTIRVWNIDEGVTVNSTFPKNIYSKELLKIIYTDEDLTNIQDISTVPVGTSSDIRTGVRCLQISPDGQLLAAGDRSGNLRVYDLQFVDQIMKIEAHEAEILCVEFSDPESGYRLLATSSRDRLIHIFDINKDFALVQTIDDHASSVTAVRFNYDQGLFQLLSCGADKHIMFHSSQELENGRGMQFVRENTIAVGKATMYDMDIEPTRKFATTCGQDRNVRVYDIQAVKQTQCYKGSLSEDGTLIKIQLDPSGLYAATSCSDKSVNIYDFEAGDCAAIMYGHSELVTGLKFTQDGSRLISVSGDNCIFIWKLIPAFTQAILIRMQELGKPLPAELEIETDPLSALKSTFVIPKNGKDNLHCDTIEEEEFADSDPKIFDQDEMMENQFDYRFSVGRLPAWAKKQITGESENQNRHGGVGFSLPSGRWAQRVNDNPVVLTAAHENTTMSGTTLSSNATVQDSQSTVATNSVLAGTSTIADDSVFQRGQPYSSHSKSQNKQDESVIYIPASQEEFDAEIARKLDSKTPAQKTKLKNQLCDTSKDEKCKEGFIPLKKIKSKMMKKSASLEQHQSSQKTRRHSAFERPKLSSLIHSSSMTNLCNKNSQDSRGKRPKSAGTRKQSVDENASSPRSRCTGASTPKGSPRQQHRRASLPNLALDKNNYKNKVSSLARNSPRKVKLSKTSDICEEQLFEVHYTALDENRQLQQSDSFKEFKVVEDLSKVDEAKNDNDFQVTARTSSKSRKISEDPSIKAANQENKQAQNVNTTVVLTGNNDNDTDSLEEEEEEEELSENLHSDTEPGIEDNSFQSPLEQHFEYLSGASSVEEDDEQTNHVHTSSNSEQKQKKPQGFFNRCRSSISAKFLSRSQKSQTGKGSQTTEEQRKRLDSLKRVMDQNQNYGTTNSRLQNSKEARRMKKLSAKSEPNLSFGQLPPPGKVANRKSLGNRRGSGVTTESQLDLRLLKEGRKSESEVLSREKVRQLRGGSTSSISPVRDKSASDIISMFNQKSSTPKPKYIDKPVSPAKSINIAKTAARGSPGISPVSSPTRSKPFLHSSGHTTSTKPLNDNKPLNEHSTKQNKDSVVMRQKDPAAARQRRRRSEERPGMKHRPKSLIAPLPSSLEELISAHLHQAHSDTELDDEGKYEIEPEKKEISLEEKPLRRSMPVSSKTGLATLQESSTSLVVRDIQIDDAETGDKNSWMEGTMAKLDGVTLDSTTTSSVGDCTIVKRLSDAPTPTAHPSNLSRNNVEVLTEKQQPMDVKHWNGRNSPPERDIPSVSPQKKTSTADEMIIDKILPVKSDEDNVTMEECLLKIEDLDRSFKEISKFQDQILKQKDSENRMQIMKILSTTYDKLSTTINEQKYELDNKRQAMMTNGVAVEKEVRNLFDALEENKTTKTENGKEQDEKVWNILELYSNAMVKMVEKKLLLSKQDQ